MVIWGIRLVSVCLNPLERIVTGRLFRHDGDPVPRQHLMGAWGFAQQARTVGDVAIEMRCPPIGRSGRLIHGRGDQHLHRPARQTGDGVGRCRLVGVIWKGALRIFGECAGIIPNNPDFARLHPNLPGAEFAYALLQKLRCVGLALFIMLEESQMHFLLLVKQPPDCDTRVCQFGYKCI